MLCNLLLGQCRKINPCPCCVRWRPRNFAQQVAQWRCSHPRQRKKYLLFFWRWAGALERGQHGRFLVSELPHALTSPSGRPPAESLTDVRGSKLLERTRANCTIFADGNKAWASHSKSLGRKCLQVSHVRMEFTRKAHALGRKDHGTQCIDRKWAALKRYIPKELSSKKPTGRLNAQIRTYVYSFVWRSNTQQQKQLQELGSLARTKA